MVEILSAQELDALLERPPEGTGRAPADERATPFTFDGVPSLPAKRMERLGAAGAGAAEALRRGFTRELGRSVSSTLVNVELASAAGAGRVIDSGVAFRFETGGARLAALAVLDVEVALAFVEARLGGAVAESQPKRPLTPVEQTLVVRLLRLAVGPAIHGFLEHASGDAPAEPFDCRPFDGEELHGAGFVAATMQLGVEGRGGKISVFVPVTRMASPPSPALCPVGGSAGIPPARLLRMSMRVVPTIPGGTISIAELADLAPGRVVRLDHHRDTPIGIACNGTVVLHGRMIRAGDRAALEISGWVDLVPGAEERR